jgi:hypothetical protein
MNISYAITVCNEYEEIQKLLSHLLNHIDTHQNEIIILADAEKLDPRIETLCENHKNYGNIKIFHKDKFNGHFSEWKNKLKHLCSKEYIFQIDADEIPNEFLLRNIDSILQQNLNIELFWVPRENYVNGLTQDHINKWNWQIDENNRINFPDYQARLFKNLPHIYWQNKVHEIIVGCTAQASLPADPRFCLLHAKNITKQEQQNNYYATLS